MVKRSISRTSNIIEEVKGSLESGSTSSLTDSIQEDESIKYRFSDTVPEDIEDSQLNSKLSELTNLTSPRYFLDYRTKRRNNSAGGNQQIFRKLNTQVEPLKRKPTKLGSLISPKAVIQPPNSLTPKV